MIEQVSSECRFSLSTHNERCDLERSRPVSAIARANSAPVRRGAGVGASPANGTAASRTTIVGCPRRARAIHSAKPDPAFSSSMVVSLITQARVKLTASR
jgi:hypothetical protein